MKWLHFNMASQLPLPLLLLLLPMCASVHGRPSVIADPTPAPAGVHEPPVPTVSTVLANDTAIANQFIDNLNLTDISAVSITQRRYVLRSPVGPDTINNWERLETNKTATAHADNDPSIGKVFAENTIADPNQRGKHILSHDTFYVTDGQPSSSSFPDRFADYDHEARPTDQLFFEQHYHIDESPPTPPTSVIEVHHHHEVTSRPPRRHYQYAQQQHFELVNDQVAEMADDDDADRVQIVYLSTTQRPKTSVVYVNNKLTHVKRKPQRPTRPKPSKPRPSPTATVEGTKHATGCPGDCTGSGPGVYPTSPDFAPYSPPSNYPPIPTGPAPFVPPFPQQPPLPTLPPICLPGYYFNSIAQRCESTAIDNGGPPPIIPGQFTGPGLNIHDKHQSNGHKHPVATGNTQFVPTLVFQQLPATTVAAPPTKPHAHHHQTHQTNGQPTQTDKKKRHRRKRRPKRPKRPKRKRRPASGVMQLLNVKKWKLFQLLPVVALINPITLGFWTLMLSPLLITMAIGSVMALLLYPWAGSSGHHNGANVSPIVIHKHHHPPRRPRWRPPAAFPAAQRLWTAGPTVAVTPPSIRWPAKRTKFPFSNDKFGVRNRRDVERRMRFDDDLDDDFRIMWSNFTVFKDSFRRKQRQQTHRPDG